MVNCAPSPAATPPEPQRDSSSMQHRLVERPGVGAAVGLGVLEAEKAQLAEARGRAPGGTPRPPPTARGEGLDLLVDALPAPCGERPRALRRTGRTRCLMGPCPRWRRRRVLTDRAKLAAYKPRRRGRHSQVVRQGSAKPSFPGSNPGGASCQAPATSEAPRSPRFVAVELPGPPGAGRGTSRRCPRRSAAPPRSPRRRRRAGAARRRPTSTRRRSGSTFAAATRSLPVRLMEGSTESPPSRRRAGCRLTLPGGGRARRWTAPAGAAWTVRLSQGTPARWWRASSSREVAFADKAGPRRRAGGVGGARAAGSRRRCWAACTASPGKVIDNRRYLLLVDEPLAPPKRRGRAAGRDLLREVRGAHHAPRGGEACRARATARAAGRRRARVVATARQIALDGASRPTARRIDVRAGGVRRGLRLPRLRGPHLPGRAAAHRRSHRGRWRW